METEQKARALETQRRQDSHHRQESVLGRSEAEITQADPHSNTAEQARELETQRRQDSQHRQKSVLGRSEAEIKGQGQTP